MYTLCKPKCSGKTTPDPALLSLITKYLHFHAKNLAVHDQLLCRATHVPDIGMHVIKSHII